MTSVLSRLLCALLLAVCGTAAGAASASPDARRIEAVGAFPIDPARRGSGAPRDGALREAVRDAVHRVAASMLPPHFAATEIEDAGAGGEAGEPPGAEPPESPDELAGAAAQSAFLDQVLGEDPFEFATRFRILDDRGVRPALLSGAPGVENEYVVVVEVVVDATRVQERLRARGVLASPTGAERRFQVRLVVEGLDSFQGYDALRRTLLAGPGVRSALPVELRRGRIVLEVEADREASAVLDDLLAATPPGLQIVPLESGPDSATLLVSWSEAMPTAPGSEPVPR